MSLSFLVPAFLAGLLALAVPIAIHLSRRQTKEPVPFPSMMFLEKTPHRTTERRQITRWPLLLLRCAAVALLVLAFARPFVEREGGVIPGGDAGDREVIILLDRSYSMGFEGRWDRAVEAALEAIDGITGGDRGTVVLFDSSADSATESTTERGVLRSAVQDAAPGARTTRYAPALRYAGRLLSSSPMPRHELVVISDFQRGSWDRESAEAATLRLPAGTVVTPIRVSGGEGIGNLTVGGVDFDRSTVSGRERVAITARLTGAAAGPVPVTLEIDGRAVESRSASMGEEGDPTVRFSPLTLPETGSVRGTVRLPEDGLAIDNEFHFVLSSDQRLGVLILEGPGTGAGASYFLDRALAIGSAPGFRSEIRRSNALRPADVADRPVVILNQTALPPGEQGETLRRHVEEGGGLVMLLGNNPLGEWQGVLPSVPQPVDRFAIGGTTIGYVDTGHPIFDAFARPRSGDFSASRVNRYRPLPNGSFPRVLARYADGGIALAERPVGEGRVLLFTSTLDGSWNDLAVQPIFLPFLHQLIKYAAGYSPARSWLTVGDPFDAGAVLRDREEYSVALTPSGRQIPINRGSPFELEEVGFYEIRGARTDGPSVSFAVNVDPIESDMSSFDPEEMRAALNITGLEPSVAGAGEELTLADRERRQNGWWYLIIAAFLILIAETLFSNRKTASGGLGWPGRGRKDGPGGAIGRERPGLAT